MACSEYQLYTVTYWAALRLVGTLAPEVNNFAHQRNLLQNVYYYCSYQEELEFLKSDWS